MQESLDRSHTSAIIAASLSAGADGEAVLSLDTRHDCRLEVWNLEQHLEPFRKVFGRNLVIRTDTVSTRGTSADS